MEKRGVTVHSRLVLDTAVRGVQLAAYLYQDFHGLLGPTLYSLDPETTTPSQRVRCRLGTSSCDCVSLRPGKV